METKPDIEKQIDAVIASAKKIQTVEPAFGFTEKTMQRMREQKVKESSVMPALYKIAAILILAIVNIYTVKSILNSQSQPQQVSASAPASVNDLVNEYQVSDINEELSINKTIQHE